MWQRNTFVAFTALALAAGGATLTASPYAGQASAWHCKRVEALATKLALTDQQKEDLRKICTDFHKKTDLLKFELQTLHQEKHEAMTKVLTEEQRGKVRAVVKEEWNRKWQAVAAKLNLSDEQKQRIEKIRDTYGKKFRDLAAQKDGKRGEFRKLGREKRHAIGRELTADQRDIYRDLVRAEKRQKRNPTARREFWKGVGEKLGVTAEQKEQFKKIRTDFEPTMEKSVAQLEGLRKEARAAVRKLLTPEQRDKLREMHKGGGKEKAAEKAKG